MRPELRKRLNTVFVSEVYESGGNLRVRILASALQQNASRRMRRLITGGGIFTANATLKLFAGLRYWAMMCTMSHRCLV
jgi:hypothetical protein